MAPMSTTSNTCFPGPTPLSIPNGISIGSAVFFHFIIIIIIIFVCTFAQLTAEGPIYFTMGRPFRHQNCPFTWGGGSGPPSNILHGCLAPADSTTQNSGCGIGGGAKHLHRFSGFCRAHDRDRQTTILGPSVAIGHI